jgi:hypothetical protein
MLTTAIFAAVVLVPIARPFPVAAQAAPAPQPANDVSALAKETQNPVGNLTTVPFQFNFNTGGDLEDRTFFNMNFQPVIPFRLSSSVNVVARTIVPINSAPLADGTHSSGIGDIQQQIFFTPAKPGGMIWGVGPTFSFPTATASASETGTWAMGPVAVLVKNTGPWVLGSLISQLWPMADAGGDPEMNLLTIQPFVNYNFGHGWAMSFSPIITANWDAPDGNQWTVPLGIGLTRTTLFNHRPMNIGINYYYNVERPDGGPGQQLRLIVALLYPR